MPDKIQAARVTVHGHRVEYVKQGKGPALLLLHGALASRDTWRHLVPVLARNYTVIAPDFLGSGNSEKPMGDYSLSAHAAVLRDLLDLLQIDRVTLIGHSLGGGVAMQFVYLFPDRCERLVLVSTGGLGRELGLLLRASSLPGASLVLPLLGSGWMHAAVGWTNARLASLGLKPSIDAQELWRGCLALRDPEVRRSFLATMRGIVDRGGQTVSALNRLHLLEQIPTLIVWGAQDRMIPLKHGVEAHRRLRGSRLDVLPEAGHFPHITEPVRFLEVLNEFVAATPAHGSRRRPVRGGRPTAGRSPPARVLAPKQASTKEPAQRP